jgi:dipeptidyl aminopeptidase/acylaminoacyl peptidase
MGTLQRALHLRSFPDVAKPSRPGDSQYRRRNPWLWWFLLSFLPLASADSPRSVTATDGVSMTRMHSWALSHDGKKLIVVLSRGNLERNSNDYSLVLFEELDFSHSPKAQVLVTFASSSNREGIHEVKWLNDDETIAFLGENPGEVSQVHRFNITHRHLEQFSNSVTPVSSYDITPDGSEIIFFAERQTEKKIHADQVRRNGIVVNDESVDDLLAGDCARPPSDLDIFLQKRGRTAQAIPSQDAIFPWAAPPSLSPDGRYALITTFVRKIPQSWQFYQAAKVRAQIRASRQDIGGPAPIDDRIGQDRRLGRTAEQSARNLSVLAYDQAIEYLNERGIIDPHHVGITGFSRTVCFVAYSLTHSVHRFSAASLVDGIDCGYLQYISTPRIASDGEALNGGVPPFGKGLAQWKRESPGFNLDRVTAAVRLEAHGESGGILSQWEWFAGLSLLHKPVEYFYLPDAAHQLVKPWERVAAQNGLIDWFVFWLKGEEDPNPAKADQYVRWRAMRRVQGPSD